MKKTIIFVAALVIVAAGSFYGGMKYGADKQAANGPGNFNFGNLSAEKRQQRFQQMGGDRRVGGGQQPAAAGLGMLNGEIISSDSQSVTVKLRDGGSKIVFFSSSTQIMKSDIGSAEDLKAGENIMANGATNSDGSVTAQMIQLRPATSTPR